MPCMPCLGTGSSSTCRLHSIGTHVRAHTHTRGCRRHTNSSPNTHCSGRASPISLLFFILSVLMTPCMNVLHVCTRLLGLAERLMKSFDLDGDGKVTQSELIKVLVRYCIHAASTVHLLLHSMPLHRTCPRTYGIRTSWRLLCCELVGCRADSRVSSKRACALFAVMPFILALGCHMLRLPPT